MEDSMSSRSVALAGAVAAAAAVATLVVPVLGQSPSTPAPGPRAASWTPPRTPWGDPDIQGVYTNKYEQGTPMERPAALEGRSLEDISGDELTRIIAERKAAADARAPFLAGDPTGRIQGNAAFRDRDGIVNGSRAWMIIDPPDGQIPATTPEARRRAAERAAAGGGRRASSFTNGPFDSHRDFSLYDRCITRGFPGSMLPAIYGDSYEIVQGPGYVAIRYEMVHETHVIPLDSRPHLGTDLRFDMGDSRGHWEGNTLVVETTNLTERSAYRDANPDTLRIVERFTPTAPHVLEWTVTIDDPSTWIRPWTFSLPLTMNDQEPVMEYACHEGNYAMHNMLSASRADERKVAGEAADK
jgi:hypothetical protein